MKQRRVLTLCLFTVLAAGCGTKTATLPVSPTPLPNLAGNWQIQAAAPPPGSTAGSFLLLGELQNNGAQVTGTFRFSNLANVGLGGCALNQVVAVTGVLDSSRNLTLTSAALADGSVVTVQLVLPAVLTDFATGTIAVAGKACALASARAIGVETATVSGTFAGALTALAPVSPAAPAGSATLTLTQSAIPVADGEFPVTGTLTYTAGTCTGTVALGGNASGNLLTLTAITASPELSPSVRLIGAVVPTANSITISELLFAASPCAVNPPSTVAYSAIMARQ